MKCDNVLVFETPADNGGLHHIAKISDFGYSSTLASIAAGKRPGNTLNFCAPEQIFVDLLQHVGSRPENDLYSYGLIVWQIAENGQVPFSDKEQDEIEVLKEDDGALELLLQDLSEECPEVIIEIISGTVKYAFDKRLPLSKVRSLLRSIYGLGSDDRYET